MWKYIVAIGTHLSWLFNFLLYHSCFSLHYNQYSFCDFEFLFDDQATQSSSSSSSSISSVSTVRHSGTRTQEEEEGESRDDVEYCAVCLCKFEEGEEVTKLRCAHLFHKLCLDRWTSLKHTTCPLCRSFISPPAATQASHYHQQFQVLVFKFCSFSSESDDGCDTWWLR